MTVTAMLGAVVHATTGNLTPQAIVSATEMASGPLALLFGAWWSRRVLGPIGIFDWIGGRFLTRGPSSRQQPMGQLAIVDSGCASPHCPSSDASDAHWR
jgi:Na+/H+ antiporter NhaD/arsenite permease-like protein